MKTEKINFQIANRINSFSSMLVNTSNYVIRLQTYHLVRKLYNYDFPFYHILYCQFKFGVLFIIFLFCYLTKYEERDLVSLCRNKSEVEVIMVFIHHLGYFKIAFYKFFRLFARYFSLCVSTLTDLHFWILLRLCHVSLRFQTF